MSSESQRCVTLRRYWLADTYEQRHAAGQEPQNVDKEFLRLWFRQNCDPYKDEVCLAFLTRISVPVCQFLLSPFRRLRNAI